MIDWTKPIRRVSDKAPCRVLCTDLKSNHPIIITIGEDYESIFQLTTEGATIPSHPPYVENIPQKRKLYLNVYPEYACEHVSKEIALKRRGHKCIAYLEIEFEEGEGL